MAYTTKDGHRYENQEIGRAHDRSRGHKPAEENKAKEKPAPEETEGEQPIEDSIDEHGPVEHMEMHAHHEDGHVHKSKHHDAESAHEHVAKAFGEQQPEEEAEAQPMPAMGTAPPGMATS